MQQPGAFAQGSFASPGPVPSPFPPSPMMPGPGVQQAGMPPSAASAPESHSGTEGHQCGKSQSSYSHVDPAQAPPQAGFYNPPYYHEQYLAGPNLMNYGLGFPPFAAPAQQYSASAPSSFLGLNFNDSQFWKGALIGAGVVLLLTNESLQKGMMKAGAKMFTMAQQGVEEMKEKFEDIQAELKHKAAE